MPVSSVMMTFFDFQDAYACLFVPQNGGTNQLTLHTNSEEKIFLHVYRVSHRNGLVSQFKCYAIVRICLYYTHE